MRHNVLQSNARRTAAAVAIAAALIPAGAALATPAQAADAPATGTGTGTAVIDPMLTIFGFGGSFGIQTGCPLLTAAALDIAGRAQATEFVSPVVDQINDACAKIAEAVPGAIEQGKTAAKPLAFINQFANPAIAQLATVVSGFGQDNNDVIAPFGRTVAGLGGTINFFQGA